jgi:arginyl-tRNA synthetase
MQEVERAIAGAVKDLFDIDVRPVLVRTDEQFGDFSCNIAMQISGKLANPPASGPREISEQIAKNLQFDGGNMVKNVQVAGPGFLNITLSDEALWQLAEQKLEQTLAGKTVLVEYLDPNPFKEIHIGHAYSGTVGDAIGNLFSAAGATVHRVTYQGDVGLHVAKALYGIFAELGEVGTVELLNKIDTENRPTFLGKTYSRGATAYDGDESAKRRIQEINKRVYDRSNDLQNQVYDICKQWSLDYFDQVYSLLGFTPFEKNYMEGAVAEEGKKLVESHIDDGIFERSDGAVVFRGDKFGLHTRVFINSEGLPTYEAKDLGNAAQKFRDFAQDRSVIITAEEQAEYFKVMLKALEQFEPEQAQVTTHIAHGMVNLSTGKMSSRTGKVLRAVDVLQQVEIAAKEIAGETADEQQVHNTALAAMKYVFLKNRIGGDIAFDINESVALEGNSGPYLQYAHARARSILAKVQNSNSAADDLQDGERSLARKIGEYAEVVDKAVVELMPHHICTYLYELAQVFNRFYEHNRVIGDEREALRIKLIQSYANTLRSGLQLLNIPTPEKM